MKQNPVSSLLITLFLAGCSSIVVTPTSVPLEPTISFLPTRTRKPSPTFSPAQATQNAFEPTFIAMSETQEYFMNTEVPATLEARNVHCKDGFYIELYVDILRQSNDQWTLFTCSPKPQNDNEISTPGIVDYGTRYTQIIKTDLSKTWTIQHDTFDYSVINRHDALMTPFKWTADGKYLYLYPSYFPHASGFPRSVFLYTVINSLYRINLETGVFELVLRRDQFGALEFSPDECFLIYSELHDPDVIHLRDMESGNDLTVELGEDIIAAGAFLWNSEGTKVVFFVGYKKQSEDWQDDLSSTAIFVLTPKYMHAQKIMAKDPRIFEPIQCPDDFESYWLNENTICLFPYNEELENSKIIYSINIETGTIEFLQSLP